jgi:hypothetical protein
MNDLRKRVEMIIRGLDSGEFEHWGEHPDFQEEIDIISNVREEEDGRLNAALTAIEEMSAHVRVDEIPGFIHDHYQGHFRSRGEAIRESIRDRSDSDRLVWLDEFDRWIDWQEVADSPDMSDFSFIELDNVDGVFLFLE